MFGVLAAACARNAATMRTRIVLTLCLALALTVGVATATAGGGNSGNAKLCQKGGWQLLSPNGTDAFASEEDCVSWAAEGGQLLPVGIGPF